MSEWGKRIRARRKELRLTQKALADFCGVKPPSVSDWETGETQSLEGDHLLLAAEFLQTSAHWISTGKDQSSGAAENPDMTDAQRELAAVMRERMPVMTEDQARAFAEMIRTTTPKPP